MKNYDVNEAGQVAAYICDLRHLPHEEQLYWAIYNEEPKAGLSERAITTDFAGQWPEEVTSRERLVHILQRWAACDVEWWKWRPDDVPNVRIVVPRTGSRNEWAASIGRLYTDVIEGFGVKELRVVLEEEGGEVDKSWRSRVLLERILSAKGELQDGQSLAAFQELIEARNLGAAHAGESKFREFSQRVLAEHDTYAAHFECLCDSLADDLTLVDQAMIGTRKTKPTVRSA